MFDLDRQVRDYVDLLDQQTRRVSAGAAIERGTTSVRRFTASRPTTVVVGAAVVTALVVGSVVLLGPFGGNEAAEQVTTDTVAAVDTPPAQNTTASVADSPSTTATTSPSLAPALAMSWIRIESDVFGGSGRQWISDIAVGGPGLVAVGADGSGGDDDAAVWYSSDGQTWSKVAHDEAVFGGSGDQYMMAVTAGGPGFVAVGEEDSEDGTTGVAAVWISEDGIGWSRVPHDEATFGGEENTDVFMKDVTAFGSGLVAVGMEWKGSSADAAAWVSADGMIWERVPPDEAVFGGPQSQVMWAVVPAGPRLVAVGQGGDGAGESGPGQPAAAWTSTDGRTWSRVPDQVALLSGYPAGEPGSGDWARMDDVMVGGPGLVAVGRVGRCQAASPCTQEAAIWNSADGVTWERSTVEEAVGTPFDQIFGVSSYGDVLIAAGDGRDADFQRGPAVVWASTDGGQTWDRVLSAAAFGKLSEGPNAMSAAVEFESRLIAVGSSESDAAIWIATNEE
jgi:hypothetical protein